MICPIVLEIILIRNFCRKVYFLKIYFFLLAFFPLKNNSLFGDCKKNFLVGEWLGFLKKNFFCSLKTWVQLPTSLPDFWVKEKFWFLTLKAGYLVLLRKKRVVFSLILVKLEYFNYYQKNYFPFNLSIHIHFCPFLNF